MLSLIAQSVALNGIYSRRIKEVALGPVYFSSFDQVLPTDLPGILPSLHGTEPFPLHQDDKKVSQ